MKFSHSKLLYQSRGKEKTRQGKKRKEKKGRKEGKENRKK